MLKADLSKSMQAPRTRNPSLCTRVGFMFASKACAEQDGEVQGRQAKKGTLHTLLTLSPHSNQHSPCLLRSHGAKAARCSRPCPGKSGTQHHTCTHQEPLSALQSQLSLRLGSLRGAHAVKCQMMSFPALYLDLVDFVPCVEMMCRGETAKESL